MSYYPEVDSHIEIRSKYACQIMLLKLDYATGIDESDSLIHLIHHTFALKAEV